MRIIAGDARGRAIAAPKGQDTRPTQDYVRESLFNILMRHTPDACVLDLFAGSGALSLEAISRGAAEATLVDCAADAIACIRSNVETLRYGDFVTVLQCDWQAALDRLAKMGKVFTLVFLDPPYRMTETDKVCRRMAELALLAPDAMVVLEHRLGQEPALDACFVPKDMRRYGDTVIHFYKFEGGAATHE